MNVVKVRSVLVAWVLVVAACVAPRWAAASETATTRPTSGKTIRVLCLGNSFSRNATQYLKELASAAGHTVVLGQIAPGGCSLERYSKAIDAYEQATDKEAVPFPGNVIHKTLREQPWDVVTIQQYSFISHDVETYRPYAKRVYDCIKQHAPRAEVLIHQTWAYRVDDKRFGDGTMTQKQMYEQVRKSYHTIAGELGIRVIPVGDAFWRADTDTTWGYRPTPGFDAKTLKHPDLPDQLRSLHVGYRWAKDAKTGKFNLGMDGHHASANGCYLVGCVWFEFLLNESVLNNSFVPKGVDPAYAAFLRKVAHETVQATRGN